MKMKKLFFAIISLLIIGLSACSPPFLSRIWDDNHDVADARLLKILAAFDSKDSVALTSMFSQETLNKAEDLDAGIEYVLGFYQGKMISQEGAVVVSAGKTDGKRKKELECNYTVVTDKEEYLVFFIEQTVNDENPDEIGLCKLQVIKKEDEDSQFQWGMNFDVGIYCPEETNENS